jgi:hypothetical protein
MSHQKTSANNFSFLLCMGKECEETSILSVCWLLKVSRRNDRRRDNCAFFFTTSHEEKKWRRHGDFCLHLRVFCARLKLDLFMMRSRDEDDEVKKNSWKRRHKQIRETFHISKKEMMILLWLTIKRINNFAITVTTAVKLQW